MSEEYNFEFQKDSILRFQESVIVGFSYRYLWHTELELMLVMSGNLVYFAGGEHYHLHQGDILFFNEGCGHSIISNEAENMTLSLKLHPQVLREWGVRSSLRKQSACLTQKNTCSPKQLRRIRQGIAGIHSYLMEQNTISVRAAEMMAVLVFAEVLRSAGLLEEMREFHADSDQQKADGRLDGTFDYLAEHLTERISLQEAASQAGYNRTYFSGLFRKQTGLSLTEYMNRMRVQKAIGYLEEGEDTLTDIAHKSGFPDYNTFSSCMLRYCGRKPQDYRNRILLQKKNTEGYRHYAKRPDEAVEQFFSSLQMGCPPDKMLVEIGRHADAILNLIQNG